MKKINVLFLAFTAIILFSCSNTSKTEEVIEEVSIEAAAAKVVETIPDIPDFENFELAAFIKAFNPYVDKYMELLKSGDMKGLEALEAEGEALKTKEEALMVALSETDGALLAEYLREKTIEIFSASSLDDISEKIQKEMGN